MKGVASSLIAILLLLTGCSSNSSGKQVAEKAPQVMRFNIQQEPSSLDPRKVTTIQDINVCRAFMDGLFRIDKNGELQPALAQSHTVSANGLIYTFYLRDAQWSDGSTITSHDFVYAWKSLLSPKFPSQSAYHLYSIKNAELVKKGTLPSSMLGVEATDDKTIIVRLNKATPDFISLTAHPVFYPVSQTVDKKNPKWADSVETFVSSGPFHPVEWKHHYSIVAKKNSNYWDTNVVKLDRLEMVMVSADTEARMFDANELDWTGSPISTLQPELIKEGEVHKAPFLGTRMVNVNTTRKALSSPKVRHAFALAVDRAAISEHIMHNLHDPAFGFVPQCMKLETPAFSEGEDALALLEEGLAEAGIEKNDLDGLVFSFMGEDQNKRYAETIQQQWQDKLGVTVSLQAFDRKILLENMVNKQYDFALASWIADVENPMNFLEIFHDATIQSNRTGWENAEYTALIDKANSVLDDAERVSIMRRSEQLLLDQAPIIPLTHFSLLYKHKENVQNVVVTPLGYIDFKWAEVEGEL